MPGPGFASCLLGAQGSTPRTWKSGSILCTPQSGCPRLGLSEMEVWVGVPPAPGALLVRSRKPLAGNEPQPAGQEQRGQQNAGLEGARLSCHTTCQESISQAHTWCWTAGHRAQRQPLVLNSRK